MISNNNSESNYITNRKKGQKNLNQDFDIKLVLLEPSITVILN